LVPLSLWERARVRAIGSPLPLGEGQGEGGLRLVRRKDHSGPIGPDLRIAHLIRQSARGEHFLDDDLFPRVGSGVAERFAIEAERLQEDQRVERGRRRAVAEIDDAVR